MQENLKDDVMKVYEIGYLLVSSIPREKVADVATNLMSVLSKKKAEIIGEEAPELIPLSYTMIKKIGTTNHRFDQAFFGWVKFELATKEIEEVKKAFDFNQDVLRYLLITTIKENTYLGKKAPVAPGKIVEAEGVPAEVVEPVVVPLEDKSASIEEMDKSIDEMVKEA
jgi:ribosomal protein S6